MAPKYTLANGADFYAQNGSTEFKVITSTGEIVAGTLDYGNSTANEVIDSSGNVILDNALLAKSTDVVIIDSSGHIKINNNLYGVSTAGHVICDSSGNLLLGSSGKLFASSTTVQVIDSTGNIMLNGVIYNKSTDAAIIDSSGHININNSLYGASTEGHVICDSSGNLLLGSSGKLFAQTTDSTGCAVNSSGELLYRGYDINNVQIISSGAASTGTAILGYGVTIYQGDTACSLGMSAPVYTGVRKTIIFTQGSSLGRSLNSSVTTGSADNNIGFSFYSIAATNSSAITFSTGSTLAATLNLIGMTTKQWLKLGEDSTVSNFSLATT